MCGRTHKDHIEKIFEIIQYLLERIDESSILKNSELEKMFSVFITKRVSNFESETLFDLISSVEKNQRGYSTEDYLIADKKVRKYIFQTCLCKKNFVTPHDYSPKSIRCFKDLFLDFNNRENKIQMDRESTIIKGVKDIELEGIETLWQIALQASNPVVQERAGYLLALIHYIYMDKKKFPEWSGITDGYVKELMETLKINTNDKIIAANNMRVLKQFIDTFETLDFPEHFRIFYKKLYEVEDDNEEEIMDSKFYNFYERKWNRQNLATFAITHKKTDETHMLEVAIKDSVLKFKRKIAKMFGVKAKHFELTYGTKSNNFLEPHFDWCYVWEVIEEVQYNSTPVSITFDQYDQADIQGRSITYSISNNEEYLVGLCNYLKAADSVSSLEATNVIGRLPVLEQRMLDLKMYIEAHKIKKYDHWYAVLKVKFDQPEEIMFKMRLLQKILAEPDESMAGAREEFINHDGISFLIDIIVQA